MSLPSKLNVNPRAIPQSPLPPGFEGGHANASDAQLPKTPEYSNPRPANNKPVIPSACRFSPFDEDLNTLDYIPQWQIALDDHFTSIFRPSVLSRHAINDMVAPALRIIGCPTPTRVCVLARIVYMHWFRMQVRSRNSKILVREIVGLITGITSHLGRIHHLAKDYFLGELGLLCVEKLKLTLRWYVDAGFHHMLGVPRENLFMRVMAVIAMISHLFNSEAIAVMYAFLRELGPKFAMQQDGWGFILRLLAALEPLTKDRLPVDPVHQLVSAIITLVERWRNYALTLYYTHPGA